MEKGRCVQPWLWLPPFFCSTLLREGNSRSGSSKSKSSNIIIDRSGRSRSRRSSGRRRSGSSAGRRDILDGSK